MPGPLAGIKVVEFAGIGPGPFCAMLLADLGAEVVCIARPGGQGAAGPVLGRSRQTVEIDLRQPEGAQQALASPSSALASWKVGISPMEWKCSQAMPCGSVIQCFSLFA